MQNIFQRKKVIDNTQASLTGTATEQSCSGRKNNTYLLKESEEQETGEANAYEYVTAESNKIIEDNNSIIISREEEDNNLEYQETIKVDVKNIAKNKTKIWILIYKIFMLHLLRKGYFPTKFWTNVKKFKRTPVTTI